MSVIAIAAVGFTMQFGITNMINLAYGEVMISSAYVAYYLNKAGISIWIGMVAGALIGAGGIVLTTNQIAIIGIAVVLMLLIHGLLRYTRLGKAMRATAANPTLARNCGIPTHRV